MRDKNNLSHAETPVFMRVLRDYVRNEGFLLKPARVAAVGVVFLAEVAMKAAFFADNLYHHNSKEEQPNECCLPSA